MGRIDAGIKYVGPDAGTVSIEDVKTGIPSGTVRRTGWHGAVNGVESPWRACRRGCRSLERFKPHVFFDLLHSSLFTDRSGSGFVWQFNRKSFEGGLVNKTDGSEVSSRMTIGDLSYLLESNFTRGIIGNNIVIQHDDITIRYWVLNLHKLRFRS